MAIDHAYRVRWPAGEIVVHATSEKEARNIGVEYIRVDGTKRLVAESMAIEELEKVMEANA